MTDLKQPIENKSQLVDFIASGEKPRNRWVIGTEHEKFCFHLKDHSSLEYGGDNGIRSLLKALSGENWSPVCEEENIIALDGGGATVTLEPGGQLELSGKLLGDIHQTCNEVQDHLARAKAAGDALGVGFLGIGFHPTLSRSEAPQMPKGRYDIMRAYMPKKGKLGLDMMHRTATVQVNLDFSDEQDMVKKFRVGLALQPVATAIFANSPFTEGKPNGFQSYRSHIWTDTDPDRTGQLPFVFEDGFGYERWVDYVLDVPMYFVYRDGYINAAGQSFRDFLEGRLPALPGEKPTVEDWFNHLTTPFPEVRLKTFIEMRGADGGPWSKLCALPALWVGLLYHQSSLDAAYDLVKDWTIAEIEALRRQVPRHALRAKFRSGTVRDVAREVLAIAEAGLKSRARKGSIDDDESGFLQTLHNIVGDNRTPADELLEAYNTRWKGDISRIFDEFSY